MIITNEKRLLSSKRFSLVIIIIITINDQTKISKLKSHQIALHFVVYLFITCCLL